MRPFRRHTPKAGRGHYEKNLIELCPEALRPSSSEQTIRLDDLLEALPYLGGEVYREDDELEPQVSRAGGRCR